MKTYILPIFSALCCTLAGATCFVSPLYAEGMNVTVTEPDTGRNELWVKIQGEGVVGISAQLGASGYQVTADMLKIKLHCDSDFDVDWYKFRGETYDKPNNERTRYFQENNYHIAFFDELVTQCKQRVQGNGTFVTDIDLPQVTLQCRKFAYIGPDSVKKRVYDTLSIPIKVKCVPAPDTVKATVSQKWTYSCPGTPITDQAFWEKYRFVVKGTNSSIVVSQMPQGEVECVRAFQSDGWLEEEGIFQPLAKEVQGAAISN